MIVVRDVTKKFGVVRAVDGASFSLEHGRALALLGANGAGKSTLIKCILGLLSYSGAIYLNGKNIREDPKESKSLIGYVPQEPEFYDIGTREILLFFASLRRVSINRVDRVLDITGLSGHGSKSTTELSGGMRQRLSFAIALLSEPPVLILDEPTSNLDAQARKDFLALVSDYKDEGKTVLFSSHRLDEVDLLADSALFMRAGKVILESEPQKLSESLGLKVKMNLVLPEQNIEQALSLLMRGGFSGLEKNGSGINIEIESSRRVKPINELLNSGIEVKSFNIEEPTMDSIVREVEEHGDS